MKMPAGKRKKNARQHERYREIVQRRQAKESKRARPPEGSEAMKSILIDPSNKTVTDIERDDDFKNIAPLIAAESGLFCPVRIGRNVVLYVDDEGLLTQPNPHGYFRLADYPQVLAGKGLVVGVSVSGYDEDAPFDAATLAPHVEFIDNPDPAEIEAKIEVVGWDRDTGVETRQTITPPTTTRGKH